LTAFDRSVLLRRRRLPVAIVSLVSALLLALVSASASQAVTPPYEPNDSPTAAYGPLAINQTYAAAMETSNDKDYFYFYVSTLSTSQVMFSFADLSSGSESGIRANIYGSDNRYIGVSRDASPNRPTTEAVTLSSGKYYVAITPDGGYGDTYTISTSGTEGAFGEYSFIAGQCAAATAGVEAAQKELTKATVRLKRASARVTRSNHKSYRVRKRARAAQRKARNAVNIANDALKASVKNQQPWCSIPQ
jgi:hypothetical protein